MQSAEIGHRKLGILSRPEGTACAVCARVCWFHVVPSGLYYLSPEVLGLTPEATTYRHFRGLDPE